MKKAITVFAIIMAIFHFGEATAQERTVSGRVISAEDNAGLPGVNILVKGSNQGAVTDFDGTFKLNIPDKDAILVFSFVGFETQEVPAGNKSVFNITLRPDIS